jgi:hypothetical protein
MKFVHYSSGWYAQKHPDDDFADTFAVWLDPNSEWQKRYDETPALTKLLYVDRMVREHGRQLPIIASGKLDIPVQTMSMTLDEWYKKCRDTGQISISLPNAINNDLRKLFSANNGNLAVDILKKNRKQLIREVNNWTGMNLKYLSALIDELIKRIECLGLHIGPERTTLAMMSASIFVTTLVMNYFCRGQFVDT